MAHTATVEPGWWDENIPPDANPIEVVKLVEELMPTHPALPELRRIETNYRKATGREERATIKCPTCRDESWVWLKRDTVRRCVCTLAGGVNFHVPAEKKRKEYGI